MALGTAIAAARGAQSLEIPENGYTSLNPPLGPERGGPLSTRSTHPATLARFNALVAGIGIEVSVSNPHQNRTKGELVAAAAASSPGDFSDGAAGTHSCGKMNGFRYKGGNPNRHCGLCVPCQVRRASLIAAGVADRTAYLFDSLTGAAREKLLRHRSGDVYAVQKAILRGLDDTDVIALSPFPPGFDLDAAVDLCERGLKELERVPAL